jgi:uncharacterized membrane protein
MVSPFVFWPCLAGLVVLVIGLIFIRREFAAAKGLDKLVVLGPVFVAAPLAVFAGEHLAGPRVLMQLVPPWMPARLFWAYFVGFALLAAALSLIFKKYLRWSAPLLALMFFVFVLSIHIPGVIAHPKNRIFWTIMLRETAFAGGALALAGSVNPQSNASVFVGRMCISVTVIFFAIEHFLHPQFAPGVPLEKMTPAWVPFHSFWAYLVGAILLIAGAAMLFNKKSRIAAASVGLVMTLLTLFLYLPILATATGTSQLVEGVNYVFDTLLFGGTALLLAAAIPRDNLTS